MQTFSYSFKIVFLFYLMLDVAPLQAQEYSYVQYDNRSGLPSNIIYCAAQDRDGFMWFATESGLSRYDGTRFVNYTTADGLPDNEIIRLFVDSRNRVWIIPFKFSICYYQDGKIHNAENDSLIRKLAVSNEVVSIVENAKQEIAIFQQDKMTFISPDDQVKIIDSTPEAKIYGCFTGGLKDSVTFQFVLWSPESPNTPKIWLYRNNHISLLTSLQQFGRSTRSTTYVSQNLDIYTNADRGSLILLIKDKIVEIKSPVNLAGINGLNDSLVAFNSGSYVEIYNFRRQRVELLINKEWNFSYTMEDREGNLWFCTNGQGAYRLASTAFRVYQFKSGSKTLQVHVVKKYDDTLYAGTDELKLWSIDVRNSKAKNLDIRKGTIMGYVSTIDKLSDGSLLMGSNRGLVKLLNNRLVFDARTMAVKSVQVYSDNMLVGTSSSAIILKTDLSYQDILLFNRRATAVYNLHDFKFLGSLNGLYVMGTDHKLIFLGDKYEIFRKRISCIQASSDGTLWIGTFGDGVVGYQGGKIVATFNAKVGLTSNICRSLFVTGNTIWIGTEKGLNKVTPQNGSYVISRYTISDGLISNIINSIFVDGNTVYAGTPEGISYFDESKAFTRSMCALTITGIRSRNHQWPGDTTRLHFDHYDNNIRFEFAGITFKSAGEVTYQYRLDGLNDNWLTTQDNFLEYPTLPSGHYVLHLKAINKFGVQSKTVLVVFTVEQLLWEKTWFRIALVLLLGSLVWILVSLRIKKIRTQAKIKSDTAKKIAELEQMALKAQMNPHFIFNSLNSIQQYVIDKDILGANRFITDFSRLIRLTLELSSVQRITLKEEINYISTYLRLEKIRYESKFNYRIVIPENIDAEVINIPPMILQPFIENSVRHGVRYRDDDEGMISVAFKIEQNNLVCIVEDNGVGRKASAQMKGQMIIEYQSKGMTLTARRLEMMNKDLGAPIYIDIQDVFEDPETYTGTRVIVSFPLYSNPEV